MVPWIEGTVLMLALAAGFAGGWSLGKRHDLRMPNVAAAALVLLVGVLAGPFLTQFLLGPGLLGHAVTLLLAGAASGLTFWPMGESPSRAPARGAWTSGRRHGGRVRG